MTDCFIEPYTQRATFGTAEVDDVDMAALLKSEGPDDFQGCG